VEKSRLYIFLFTALFAFSSEKAQAKKLTNQVTRISPEAPKPVIEQLPVDHSCDKSFIDHYLTQRSCFLEGNSSQCQKWGFLQTALTGTALGTAAGALAGKVYFENLKKYKPTLHDKIKALSDDMSIQMKAKMAGDKLRAESFQKAIQGMIDPRILQSSDLRITSLESVQELKAAVQRQINRSQIDKKPALEKYWQSVATRIESWSKGIETNHNKLIQMEKNPDIRNFALQSRMVAHSNFQVRFQNKLSETFPVSTAKVAGLFKTTTRPPPNLTAEEQIVLELYDNRHQMGKSLEILEKGNISTEEARIAAEKKQKIVRQGTTRAGTVSGAVVGLGGMATALLKNALDKNDLKSCKDSLKLSDRELAFLGGETYLFSAAKANVKLSDRFSTDLCENIQITTPEESLPEIHEKFGGLPEGLCKIVKNEMAAMNSLLPEEPVVNELTCENFDTPNVKLTGRGLEGKMIYPTGNSTLEIPFDPVLRWPSFNETRVLNPGGQKNTSKTLDFQQRHQRIVSFTEAPDVRFDLQELSSCQSNCKTGETRTGLDCGLCKAALQARVVSSIQTPFCIPDRTPSSLVNPQVAPK